MGTTMHLCLIGGRICQKHGSLLSLPRLSQPWHNSLGKLRSRTRWPSRSLSCHPSWYGELIASLQTAHFQLWSPTGRTSGGPEGMLPFVTPSVTCTSTAALRRFSSGSYTDATCRSDSEESASHPRTWQTSSTKKEGQALRRMPYPRNQKEFRRPSTEDDCNKIGIDVCKRSKVKKNSNSNSNSRQRKVRPQQQQTATAIAGNRLTSLERQ